jgi:hypothetical protein
MIWPPFNFKILPSATILRRRQVRGTVESSAAWLMLLLPREASRALFITSVVHNCSIAYSRSRATIAKLHFENLNYIKN